MPVPPSGGVAGTSPRIGHSTCIAISSTDSRSPAASRPRFAARHGSQRPLPCRIAGTGPDHPRLEDATDPVACQQQGEAGDVVLVRMGQDHGIDPPVPRRDPRVEHDEQPIRVGAAIHEKPSAAGTLDEDRVALADVEDRDAGDPGRSCSQDAAGHRDRDDEGDRRASCHRVASARGRARRSARHRLPRCRRRWSGDRRCRRPADRRSARRSMDPVPLRQRDQPERRDRGRNEIEWWTKRDAGERQPSGRHHDRVQHAQDHPAGCCQDGPDHRRQAGDDQRAAGQRDHAGGHGGRDQRHHQEVDHGRQDRQPSERDQDDREGRSLGGQGHAEALCEPARHPPPTVPSEPVRERRPPCDQPGGRQRR